MNQNKIENWEEYWLQFDNLISELNVEEKFEIATKLTDAKKMVNGLTDGWFEFKEEFENTVKQNSSDLSKSNLSKADFLITKLKISLNNR